MQSCDLPSNFRNLPKKMILRSSLFLPTLFLLSVIAVNSMWTEHDEEERIKMIMQDEMKVFESEMRGQQKQFSSNVPQRSTFQSQRERLARPAVSQQNFAQSEPSSVQYRSEQYVANAEVSQPVPRSSAANEESDDNWCYHCTSPMAHLSMPMKRTIKDFLKIRRTTYPAEVATAECVSARNFTALHKQKCKHRYCQTLALVDSEEGASFVLRGCAENFGAIDVKQLEQQKENTCTKLHDKLDIKECICKERKYCYANGRMAVSGSDSTRSSFWTRILAFFLVLSLR